MRKFLPILLSLLFTTTSYAQSTVILTQPDAPINITEFSARYQSQGSYSSEGVRYDASYKNTSDKVIVAYALGFFAFDVFNRQLGRPLEGFSVTTISPDSEQSGAWLQRTINSALFEEHGTAVAYVALVRFQDGTIWRYDPGAVLRQLQEIESSLTLEDLQAD